MSVCYANCACVCLYVCVCPRHALCKFTAECGGLYGVQKNGKLSNEIYFMGIIDILQQYTLKKQLEHFGKSIKYDKV